MPISTSFHARTFVRDVKKATYELAAAEMRLDLGLRRYFLYCFGVANVTRPIIGADFLIHYRLIGGFEDLLNH